MGERAVVVGPVLPPGESVKRHTGSWRTMKPILDESKCSSCRICWVLCPDMSVRETESSYEILYEYCKGCGICAKECPDGAISMVEEEGLL